MFFIIIYLYFLKKINIDIMQLHIFIILHFFKKLICINNKISFIL